MRRTLRTSLGRRLVTAFAAAAVLIAAGIAAQAALAPRPSSADASGPVLYACITGGHRLIKVGTSVPACPAGDRGISWQGLPFPAPAPTPTPTRTPTPTPTPTLTPTSSPSPTSPGPSPTTPPPSGTVCVISGNNGTCGAYAYPGITNSNGFNTYVTPNCWGDPSCSSLLSANDPGNWSITQTEPLGNRAVKTYPDVQQLLNNWNGSGWGDPGPHSDTPVASLTELSSSYAENFPHNAATDAQAAYDIWLGNQGAGNGNEVMVWVDNVNRASGGASQLATATIGGRDWTLYGDRAGELIWSLDGPGGAGTFAQQSSGTVDLLGLMKWLVAHGYKAPGTVIGQVDFGWEICSTGGVPGTFSVSAYTLSMAS